MQVCTDRDDLNTSLRNRDLQLEAKEKQIFALNQSLSELQLMITSLKGLSTASEGKIGDLEQQVRTNEQ